MVHDPPDRDWQSQHHAGRNEKRQTARDKNKLILDQVGQKGLERLEPDAPTFFAILV